MISVEIDNRQLAMPVDDPRLRRAVTKILGDAGVTTAAITVAIVDDPTIHDINRRFLNHDEPTDVITFRLSEENEDLEGDIAVSADTAIRSATSFGWEAADELLLYVIHAALHLVGHDDHEPDDRRKMQDREGHYLAEFGLSHRH